MTTILGKDRPRRKLSYDRLIIDLTGPRKFVSTVREFISGFKARKFRSHPRRK